jgi:hypothetical protein
MKIYISDYFILLFIAALGISIKHQILAEAGCRMQAGSCQLLAQLSCRNQKWASHILGKAQALGMFGWMLMQDMCRGCRFAECSKQAAILQ